MAALSPDQLIAFGACPLSEKQEVEARVSVLLREQAGFETRALGAERQLREMQEKGVSSEMVASLEAEKKKNSELMAEMKTMTDDFGCGKVEYQRLCHVEEKYESAKGFWAKVNDYANGLLAADVAAGSADFSPAPTVYSVEQMMLVGNEVAWGIGNEVGFINEIDHPGKQLQGIGALKTLLQVRGAQKAHRGIVKLTMERMPDTGPNGPRRLMSTFAYELRTNMHMNMQTHAITLGLEPEEWDLCVDPLFASMRDFWTILRRDDKNFLYRAQWTKKEGEWVSVGDTFRRKIFNYHTKAEAAHEEKAAESRKAASGHGPAKKQKKSAKASTSTTTTTTTTQPQTGRPSQPLTKKTADWGDIEEPKFVFFDEAYWKANKDELQITDEDLFAAMKVPLDYKMMGSKDGIPDKTWTNLWKVNEIRYGEYPGEGNWPIHNAFDNERITYMWVQINDPGASIVWQLMDLKEMEMHYKNSEHEIFEWEVLPKHGITATKRGKSVKQVVARWREVRQKQKDDAARRRTETEAAQALQDAGAALSLSEVQKVAGGKKERKRKRIQKDADDSDNDDLSIDEEKTEAKKGEYKDDGRRFRDVDSDEDGAESDGEVAEPAKKAAAQGDSDGEDDFDFECGDM